MRVFFLLFLSMLNLFALQIKSFESEVENGKTTIITFAKEEGTVYKDVVIGKKHFPIITSVRDPKTAFALLPIGYYEKAQAQDIFVHYLEGKQERSTLLFLDVRSGIYAHEELHVDPSKVNPKSPQVKKRIEKEYNEAMKTYNHVTDRLYIKEPFEFPIDSNITSDFGKARVYNGSLKGYHSGTDFRAQVGTKIKASNDGKVALVKDRFYSGGTIIIDHGYGIYTCYFHMSKFDVKEGEMVRKGEVIGLSGASGRVTGPHLHFAARVNGIQVDPLQLITLLNKQILKEKK